MPGYNKSLRNFAFIIALTAGLTGASGSLSASAAPTLEFTSGGPFSVFRTLSKAGSSGPGIFMGEVTYIEPHLRRGDHIGNFNFKVEIEGQTQKSEFITISGYDYTHRLTRGTNSRTWGDMPQHGGGIFHAFGWGPWWGHCDGASASMVRTGVATGAGASTIRVGATDGAAIYWAFPDDRKTDSPSGASASMIRTGASITPLEVDSNTSIGTDDIPSPISEEPSAASRPASRAENANAGWLFNAELGHSTSDRNLTPERFTQVRGFKVEMKGADPSSKNVSPFFGSTDPTHSCTNPKFTIRDSQTVAKPFAPVFSKTDRVHSIAPVIGTDDVRLKPIRVELK